MAEERLSYSPLLMQGDAMTRSGNFMIEYHACCLAPGRVRVRPHAHVAANFANFRW